MEEDLPDPSGQSRMFVWHQAALCRESGNALVLGQEKYRRNEKPWAANAVVH